MSPEDLLKYMVANMKDLEGNEHLLPEIDSEAVMAAEEAKRAEAGIYGDMAGLDDPRDAPWRLKAEELVKGAVATVAGAQLYDVTWNIADLVVTLEGDAVGIDQIVDVNKAIQAALDPFEEELEILSRHELLVSTRGVPGTLTTEKEFVAFKGFDVIVETSAPEGIEQREPILGKLQGRDVHETLINVHGRIVKIPNYLVASVKLPEAEVEPGDPGNPKKEAKPKKPKVAKVAKAKAE